MTSREITAVALKVLALYLAILGIFFIGPGMWAAESWAQSRGEERGSLMAYSLLVVAVLVKLFLAYLAWRMSNLITRDILKHPTDSPNVAITPLQFELVLYRGLGVYFVFTYVGTLCDAASAYVEYSAYQQIEFGTFQALQMLPSMLIVLAGAFMLVRPLAFAKVMRRLGDVHYPENLKVTDLDDVFHDGEGS